ncbi:T9SS type A sorting domain-containing protein [Brumimicrobium oceani]|uniref:Secretion system C-terminal sorting domain-containing protein n=1 Tax=Brumimicrobium oceani TaxID=2100725 RepID=A0A2U2X237_9FLAO|nr:T9SS type A sorting domain-containing protein [Brumimicrobium oceani]PWH81856.1 hypothetical protein DIT68_14280 [Brumimicrobium oceani]
MKLNLITFKIFLFTVVFLSNTCLHANEDLFSIEGGYISNEMTDEKASSEYILNSNQNFPDDAAITAIGAINLDSCLVSEDITVDLLNNGTTNLTSCWIHFEANGVLIQSLYWTGSLIPGETLNNVFISTFNDFYPTVDITVWSELPNGTVDMNTSNDSLNVHLFPNKLKGTYTVGGANPNFNSLSDAFNQLDTSGVCGDVILNIRNGLYYETISIDSILASNMNYRVTVQSESQNPQMVTIDSVDIVCSSTHNVEFNNLTFKNGSIDFTEGSKNLIFDQNVFDSAFVNIYNATDNLFSDSVMISNNIFNGGSIKAHSLQGVNAVSNHFMVKGNEFYDSYGISVEINNYKNIEISHNRLQSHSAFSPVAISVFYQSDSLSIDNNIITKSTAGHTMVIESAVVNDDVAVKIFNNSIHQIVHNVNYLNSSIDISNLQKLEFMHNTVFLSTVNNSPNSQALLLLSGVDSAFIKNNMLINDGEKLIYKLNNNIHFDCDFNNYWNDHNFATVTYGGSTLWTATLAEFSLIYSIDNNSTFIKPYFASSDFLYPMNALSMDNLGTPISYIDTDILNSSRDLNTPDVGAYEFFQLQHDIALENPSWIDTAICAGGSVNLIFDAFNNGSEQIDSFTVYVDIENQALDTIIVYQNIAPQQTISFNLGSYTFTNLITDVNISIALPNGYYDSIPMNNNFSGRFHTKLDGIYTVGDTTADFVSINDALISLNRGICGPVTFKLKDGTHTDWGNIGPVEGNSPTNSITFESESLNSSLVIANHTSSSNLITFRNVESLSLRHISFNTRINLDSVNLVSVDTCEFNGGGIYGSINPNFVDSLSVIGSSFNNSAIDFWSDVNNVKILKNSFSGTSKISFAAFNTASPHPTNILISENELDINNSNPSIHANIYMQSCENFEISNNKLSGNVRSIRIKACDIGVNNVIKNNFISSSYLPFELSASNGLKIYNNSIYSNSISMEYNTNVEFKNNIFQKIGSSGVFFYFSNIGIQEFDSDNNLFFGDTSMFSNSLTYSSWKSQHNKDLNSYYGNPIYTSTTDLHSNSFLADSNGMVLPEVNLDIDGQARNITHPDIGADEFDTDWSTIFDLSADSLLNPSNYNCTDNDSILFVFSNNYTDTVTSAIITWSVNGVLPNIYNWNDVLAPGLSDTVFLGLGNFVPNTDYLITINISEPNGIEDAYFVNNTIAISYKGYVQPEISLAQNFICDGDELTLSSTFSDSTYSYAWSSGAINDSIIINTGGTYWLETINSFGCMESDTVVITGYPTPSTVSILASDTVFCSDDFVTLTADPIIAGNIHTWNWNWPGGNPTSITVNDDAEVILTTEDQNGCLQFDTIQVSMVQVPYTNIWRSGVNIYCDNVPSGSTFQWYLNGALIPGAIGQFYTPVVNGVYALEVTNGICSFTTNDHYYYTLGSTDLEINEISLAPNPATTEIRIYNLFSKYSYAIYDATGRVLIERKDILNTTIPLADLSKGVYVIELMVNDQLVIKSFVKK